MTGVPECPYDLAEAGAAWWAWAWSTPAAKTWDGGALYTAARRARLEDVAALLELADDLDLLPDLLAGAVPEAISRVRFAIRQLAAAATGITGLSREMRELETQLGLGPRASRDLGVKAEVETPKKSGLDQLAERRAQRLAGASGT
ncbi:hypothetical protein [Patulibacter defluvii]|uniref:hypothetical protein n=1 Tax=Patulibacter defluvii TaxID=3095358 RepID=UPI002A74C62C|nr:hypothetical protein [Patulibacter sp. DM4]